MRRRRIATNALATVALVLGLSAGSYGAFKLPKNSVGTGDIVNGQVKAVDLGGDAVTGDKVGAAAVTPNKFVLGKLPVGLPGPTGATGDKGAPGDAGSRGAATVRYRLDHAVGVAQQTFQMAVPIIPTPSWTQAAGESDLITVGGTVNQVTGTPGCGGGGLSIDVKVGALSLSNLFAFQDGPIAGPLGGITAPDVPTDRTLTVFATNSCFSDAFEIQSLDIHVLRVP